MGLSLCTFIFSCVILGNCCLRSRLYQLQTVNYAFWLVAHGGVQYTAACVKATWIHGGAMEFHTDEHQPTLQMHGQCNKMSTFESISLLEKRWLNESL